MANAAAQHHALRRTGPEGIRGGICGGKLSWLIAAGPSCSWTLTMAFEMDDAGALAVETDDGSSAEWRQRVEARLSALEVSQGLQVTGSDLTENPLASAAADGIDSSAASGVVESIIMRTVAGRRGHPANLHQVTAALLTSEGKDAATTRYTCGSFLVVFLQTAVCMSVLTTLQWPSCIKSSDCERHRGGWCSPDRNCWDCLRVDDNGDYVVRFTNHTPREFCHPQNLTVKTFREQPKRVGEVLGNWHWEEGKTAEQLHTYAINICEGCWESLDPDVWSGNAEKTWVMDMLGLMKAGDYFALLLVTAVVCMQVSNEARDGNSEQHTATGNHAIHH